MIFNEFAIHICNSTVGASTYYIGTDYRSSACIIYDTCLFDMLLHDAADHEAHKGIGKAILGK